MKIAGLALLILVLGGALYANIQAQRAYDPKEVCAKMHPDMPTDLCLSRINFVQGAGM